MNITLRRDDDITDVEPNTTIVNNDQEIVSL